MNRPDDSFNPVQRVVPTSQLQPDTQSINKTLALASSFAQSVIKRPVSEGVIIKSKTDELEGKLDDAYEQIVRVRNHMEPHHTAMHNQAIHRLREAHANLNERMVENACEFATHFISIVVQEHKMASEELAECYDDDGKKKKTKKSFTLTIGETGRLFTPEKIEKAVEQRLQRQALGLIQDHNAICEPRHEVDLDLAVAEIAKSGHGARRRALAMIEIAKSRIFDLGGSAEDDLESILELVKGTRSNKEAEDLDVDDDDFEDDQEQIIEELEEGLSSDDDEDDDEDEEEED